MEDVNDPRMEVLIRGEKGDVRDASDVSTREKGIVSYKNKQGEEKRLIGVEDRNLGFGFVDSAF